MRLEIYARTADAQITARTIINQCLPSGVFSSVYINAYTAGKEYAIAYRYRGGYITFGLDMVHGVLRP